jgi:hypothetical protein
LQFGFSATALDSVPFPVLPLLEKLSTAQRSSAGMRFVMGMTARMMLKIALVRIVAAQAANGFPERL